MTGRLVHFDRRAGRTRGSSLPIKFQRDKMELPGFRGKRFLRMRGGS
jgi:hypothetical protein